LKRLTAAVAVALNLLHSNRVDTKTSICIFLMKLLSHRFPKVRSHTAEQLYVKLIEDASVIPNPVDLAAAKTLLSETAWGKDLGAPYNVREKRNKVSEYLGITLSEKDLKENVKTKSSTTEKDDFASYASLVNSL
jgi:predicted signal transduction protein with EAL and GGDEF domain